MVKSRYRDIVSSKGEILTNYIKAKINPGSSSGVYFIIIAKVFNGFQGNNTITTQVKDHLVLDQLILPGINYPERGSRIIIISLSLHP